MVDFQTNNNNIALLKAIEHLGIKFPVAAIEKKTGYSKGNVSKYLSGKLEPSEAFLNKFQESFNVNLSDFKTIKKEYIVVEEKEIKKEGVPYYDVDFTAGFLAVENNNQSKPDSYISHPFFKGCDYVVRASGQSMAKVIAHGDAIGLIKVENWQEFFPFGEIYAIVTKDGFRMVKVITKGEDKESFTLISKPSDNKKEDFPPQQIKKSTILAMFKVQASSHLF